MLIASCPACGAHIANIEKLGRRPYRDGEPNPNDRVDKFKSHPLECTNPKCTRPMAALEILSEAQETAHLLVLGNGGYSLKHPLRERLDAELLHCDVGEWVGEFGGVMADGGMGDWQVGVTYRVWMDYDDSPAGLTGENGTHLEGEPADA